MHHRRVAAIVAACLLVATLTTPTMSARMPAQAVRAPDGAKVSVLAYHDLWRELWEEHIVWTRMVILGILQDRPGTAEYAERLLQNYVDMEDALEPFYGEDAEVLGELIEEHLLIAVEILQAAKINDTEALNDAIARWYANGDEIAAFMSEMNPRFWPLEEARTMWREHLDATLAEALAILNGDFAADVDAFDLVHELALEMADFFSQGVIRQFPKQFSKRPL